MDLPESDYVPISALQHYVFCPRQFALIHLDCLWTENVLTAEGRVLHERAHSGLVESRKDIRTTTSLAISSKKYGIAGYADVVQYHRRSDIWCPYPVEYKHGRPKPGNEDRVQLCAQAFCLEEMHGISVPEGAIYYATIRHRERVFFDEQLRMETAKVIEAVHVLYESGKRPAPVNDARCRSCSMADECIPTLRADASSRYLAHLMEDE